MKKILIATSLLSVTILLLLMLALNADIQYSSAFQQPSSTPISFDLDRMQPITADNITQLQPIAEFTEFNNWIADIGFSPDGNLLVAIPQYDEDDGLRIWNAHTGEQLAALQDQHWAEIDFHLGSLAFSPDGSILAISKLFYIYFYYTENLLVADELIPIQILESQQLIISDIAFSPDGNYIAASYDSSETALSLWNTENFTRTDYPTSQHRNGWKLSFTPDSQYIAMGGNGYEGHVWNVETGEEVVVSEGCIPVEFSPNGQLLAVCDVEDSDYSQPQLWDITTGEMIQHFDVGRPLFRETFGFTPDGSVLLITHHYFEVETGRELNQFHGGGPNAISSMAFNPNGTLLVRGFAGAGGAFKDMSLYGIPEE